MKRILAFILALLLLVVVATGCGPSAPADNAGGSVVTPDSAPVADGEITPKNGEQFVVGMAMKVTDGYFVKKYISRFEETVGERDYKYVMVDAKFDAATQVAQMDNLIAQNVDVIFLMPADMNALIPSCKKAQEAGIPVIMSYSAIAPEGEQYTLAFAGCDDFVLGGNCGKLINEAVDGKGNLVVLGADWSLSFISNYMKALDDVLDPEITLLGKGDHGWDRSKATAAMEDFLTQYDDIDVVWATDDNTAIGAVNAIKAAKREGIKVIGLNGQEEAFAAIKAGDMYGTVIQDPSAQVNLMFQVWDKYVKGEQFEYFNYCEAPMITQANVEEYKPVF